MRQRPVPFRREASRSAAARRGSILVIAMVALLVIALMAASLLERAVSHRREVRRQDRALQAAWLAESGLSRAVARLAADPGYREETWNVSAEELGGNDAAKVSIAIETEEAQPTRRRITVVADYPDRPHDRARSRRTITVE